jgi:hypothetical protein
MKMFLPVILFATMFCVGPSAVAQMPGRWMKCVDPQSGYILQCFVTDSTPAVYQPLPDVYRENDQSTSYPAEPVYQTQHRRTGHRSCRGGIDPYSGRLYALCSYSTDTDTIIVTTNDRDFRPDIRVDTSNNSYSFPRYPY